MDLKMCCLNMKIAVTMNLPAHSISDSVIIYCMRQLAKKCPKLLQLNSGKYPKVIKSGLDQNWVFSASNILCCLYFKKIYNQIHTCLDIWTFGSGCFSPGKELCFLQLSPLRAFLLRVCQIADLTKQYFSLSCWLAWPFICLFVSKIMRK